MGTRNLTMVVHNGQTKVAQYGQFDGYPSGVGLGVLNFLKGIELPKFKKAVDKINWLTAEQEALINLSNNWSEEYPYLSREVADKILGAIYYGKLTVGSEFNNSLREVEVNIIGLQNDEEFAKDSLFCEWAYVIDLDKEQLECYKGFQTTQPSADNRFGIAPIERNSEYYPVTLVKMWSLHELPTDEIFLETLEPQEVEEQD